MIIDYLQQTPERYPMIYPMIDQAEKGDLRIVVSEISVAEVAKLKALDDIGTSVAEQVSVIEDWFERPYVSVRVVDRGVSSMAARLQRNYRLSTCDAVVLATALRHKAPTVYTYDGCTDNGGPPKNGKLITLDGQVPTGQGAKRLKITAPAGRADGQTSLQDIVAEAGDK